MGCSVAFVGAKQDASGDAGSNDAPTAIAAQACPLLTDASVSSPGPYRHRLHVASSSDGTTFQTDGAVLVEHASAPDAVTGPDGKTWVYFVNGNPGQHAIFIARQNDAGSWEAFDCVRFDGAIDETAVDPDVVRLADGRYRMFYNPLVPPNPTVPNPIISSTSSDGIHFVRDAAPAIAVVGALNPTAVQLNDGSWLMALATENKMYVASSADGKTFSVTAEFPPSIPDMAYLPELNEVRLYSAEVSGLKIRSSINGGASWADVIAHAPAAQDPSVLRTSASSWLLFYRSESR